jgi:hypothetical protein
MSVNPIFGFTGYMAKLYMATCLWIHGQVIYGYLPLDTWPSYIWLLAFGYMAKLYMATCLMPSDSMMSTTRPSFDTAKF